MLRVRFAGAAALVVPCLGLLFSATLAAQQARTAPPVSVQAGAFLPQRGAPQRPAVVSAESRLGGQGLSRALRAALNPTASTSSAIGQPGGVAAGARTGAERALLEASQVVRRPDGTVASIRGFAGSALDIEAQTRSDGGRGASLEDRINTLARELGPLLGLDGNRNRLEVHSCL